MKMIKITTVLVALFSPIILTAQGISFMDNDLEGALAKAKAENKVVFVDAYTTWCGPCKWLAANVFTNDTLGEFYNKQFVNLKLDMEKGVGVEFAKKYEVRAYPTLLFISPRGEVVSRVVGAYPSTATWMEAATQALNPFESLPYLNAQAAGRITDVEFVADYTKRLNTAGQSTDEILEQFYAANPDKYQRYDVWQITKNNRHRQESMMIEALVNEYDRYYTLFGTDAEDVLMETFMTGAMNIMRSKDFKEKQLDDYIMQLQERRVPVAEKIDFITHIMLFEQKGKWKEYQALALSGTIEYVGNDAGMLNRIAWNFYEQVEDKTALKQAQQWASRAFELETSAAILDTDAHLLYKIGAKEEAISKATEALSLARMKGEDTTSYKDTLAKFKEGK